MWVRSQDKDRLFNSTEFSIVDMIDFHHEPTGEHKVVCENETSGYTMAIYNSHEDCVTVLDMIAKAISDGKLLFEMPTQEQLDKIKAKGVYDECKTIEDTKMVLDVKLAIQKWNNLERYGFKPVSRISNSSTRYKSLAARLREYSIEEYAKAIENIEKSELLRKNADSWFNFDWFIKKNNFPKVLDGNYNSATDRIGEEEKKWWLE